MNKDDEITFEDYLDSAAFKDLLFHASRELYPKMKDAHMTLVISSGAPDAKLALEVGFAVLLDKPIIVAAMGGTPVSARLRQLATAVVEMDTIEHGKDALTKAIADVLGTPE